MIENRSLFIVVFTFLILSATISFATVPPTPPFDRSWLQDENAPRIRIQPDPTPLLSLRRDLENYIGRFRQLCHFLDSMQEHDEDDPDFGGLHEGEGDQLWSIIETDNTLEAIRDWCLYALYFDEPETFRSNVDAAWEYCWNYPAWEESPPGQMYGLHNAGWGLVAEMAYSDAYGDDQREYGQNCAEYIIENAPHIEPDDRNDILMPLVVGWSAGTLYEYGVYYDNAEYRDEAVRLAENIKEWIEEDADKLNSNEIWALCGGTAMWGVLNTLGQSDSSETADWAVDYLEDMDIFAGGGRWNNSWNIWYAHAWIEAWQLIGDDEYLANAIIIVDSLLAQDGDNDGGIPAGSRDNDDRDQSWVTAYLGWMGLYNLFDIVPATNVYMASLISPATDRPWPVGYPLSFRFRLGNGGRNERIEVPFSLRGAWNVDSSLIIEGWDEISFSLAAQWTPDEPGEFNFAAFTDHEDDADRSDDTLHFALNILPVGEVRMGTRSSDGTPVSCLFNFYNLDLNPDILFASFRTDPENGRTFEDLMVGNYRIEVIPDFPYARRTTEEYQVVEGRNPVNHTFRQPGVLLVDKDIESSNLSYFIEAVELNGRNYYNWTSDDLGSINGLSGGFNTIIYFTGDRETETISEDDQEELESFLNDGGNLFISGQNIAEDLADDPFLSDVLHSQFLHGNMRRGIISGIDDDLVTDGWYLLLFGNPGANNQASKDGILPVGEGTLSGEYSTSEDTAAIVRWETESNGKGIYFSFGFEAINGGGSSTDYIEVMSSILSWFETPLEAASDFRVSLPPAAFQSTVFPNPANGAVTIRFSAPFLQNGVLRLFDSQGRQIRHLTQIIGSSINWDGRDSYNNNVPSGSYYFECYQAGSIKLRDTGRIVIIR